MAFLDTINTITTKRIAPGVTDLVFKASPLLAFIKRNCLEKFEGGPSWQENLMYGIQPTIAYIPGDTFSLIQQQFMTGTTVTPRYYSTPVNGFLEKLKIELNGPQAVFDYVDAQLQNAAMSMSAKLAVSAYRHGQDLTSGTTALNLRAKEINGLEEALNDGTVVGPYGAAFGSYLGLARTGEPSKDAMKAKMTYPAANVGAGWTYAALEDGWNSCVIGQESPDLLVTTNRGMSSVKKTFQGQQRFEGASTDFGFQGIKFNGSVILQVQYCPGSEAPTAVETAALGMSALDGTAEGGYTKTAGETLWMLNTKTIKFYVSTDPLFGFGFTGFMASPGNSVVSGRYHYCGNLTVTGVRYSRVFYGIQS